MGQASVTCVNLIVECLETLNVDSLKLIENIEPDINNDQLIVEDLCFDLIKNYKMSKDEAKYIFIYIQNANLLKRIGTLSLNIVKHLKTILNVDNELKEIKEVLILGRFVKNLISKSIISLVEKNIDIATETIHEEAENKEIKERIIKTVIEIMKKNAGFIPLYMELIFIVESIRKIGKLSKNIAENNISIFVDNNLRMLED
ncbi:MAG: hypothetical protein A2086_12970 [Spirochaetes bacterium GWD1_27_9]|nr:MAG: hypothetical protein A2Z98_00775 [Spirochaetes bacterium GWB1_27_13]OHD43979.1 MAG: hypothetical protein A2086_12970 [Spirochaetes bacterium GWD1_27_9]